MGHLHEGIGLADRGPIVCPAGQSHVVRENRAGKGTEFCPDGPIVRYQAMLDFRRTDPVFVARRPGGDKFSKSKKNIEFFALFTGLLQLRSFPCSFRHLGQYSLPVGLLTVHQIR